MSLSHARYHHQCRPLKYAIIRAKDNLIRSAVNLRTACMEATVYSIIHRSIMEWEGV